jgi:hypothetical protein
LFAAIFVKINSATNYQLCQFSFIDPNNDFNEMVIASPEPASPTFPLATLQSASTDTLGILGDRAPLANQFYTIQVTTGGVSIERPVSTVTVPPDNAPDYQIATSRAANVKFRSLTNSAKNVVLATGGNEAYFTTDHGSYTEWTQKTMLTAQALFKGNTVIQLLMPNSSDGFTEYRLYVGNLGLTYTTTTENWLKTAVTAIDFDLQTAAQDSLIINQHSELSYKRGSSSFQQNL